MNIDIDDAPYFVYLIQGKDGALYTGITVDLERRMKQHNGIIKGGAKYTRKNRPYALCLTEKYASRSDAARREYEIKRLTHTEKVALMTCRDKNEDHR